MADRIGQILPGTLETMILAAIRPVAVHGYAIARLIEQRSGGTLSIEEGSLYPALRRLEKRGLVTGQWRKSDTGRRTRVYTITADGETRLATSVEQWRIDAAALSRVLGLTDRVSDPGGIS